MDPPEHDPGPRVAPEAMAILGVQRPGTLGQGGGDEPPPEPPKHEDKRKSVAEMVADWLREASVLIGVFGWLDRLIKGEPFAGGWAWEVVLLAFSTLALGIALERFRPRD